LPRSTPSETEHTEVQEAEVDSEDEDEEMADGDLSTVRAGFMEQCKLVSSSKTLPVNISVIFAVR
jgi:PTH2 family peptidyl-tRNA hydrolase